MNASTIALLGAAQVARTLAAAMDTAGWPVKAVASRHLLSP